MKWVNFVKPCPESPLSWNRARTRMNGNLSQWPRFLTYKARQKKTNENEKCSPLWMFLTIIRAWPGTQIWWVCLLCGCHMAKLSLHITGKFACVAFKRKDKGILARFIQGEVWKCAWNFRLHRAKLWTAKWLSAAFRNVFRLQNSWHIQRLGLHLTQWLGNICQSPISRNNQWQRNCGDQQFLSTNWSRGSVPCRRVGFKIHNLIALKGESDGWDKRKQLVDRRYQLC